MDFRDLPDRPDHPRYAKRYRDIEHLLRQRKDRLVEEGMWMDRFSAEDDFWWFCKRFTSFSTNKIDERGHPLHGELWINHPYTFWLARIYQEVYCEPQGGWVWIKIHRYGIKTTLALAWCLWIHAVDASETIGLWTHQLEKIGSGMGRGALAELQTPRLTDHFPQYRNLREGTKGGYVVDRPAGAREDSLSINSIMAAPESLHPRVFLFDDIITSKIAGNVDQIAKIGRNISDIALLMPPDSPVLCCNTPKDKADPLIVREREGLFARVISQAATLGGDFTPAGEPNLHTRKYFEQRRKETNDDSKYFMEFELEFRERAATLFAWSWIREYHERPEDLAKAAPYINIIVDGAKGSEKSDFSVIRVFTWTAHDAWATLDLIRERVGSSKIMQILLGRDKSDPTTDWIEEWYAPKGVGVVEKWMQIDPELTIWFDEHGNQGWLQTFLDHVRLRSIRFAGGRMPKVRKWPEIHKTRNSTKDARAGYTKAWKIQELETPYQAGRVAYPARGFGHGSYNGLAGGRDPRDVLQQFREDEFERMALGEKLPYDDMLDTEAVINLPQAQIHMRRPAKGQGYQLGGVEFPAPTVDNPWGLPGGGNASMIGANMAGKTWVSLL
jgi:hypothetical protein